ncbi:MAG: hypothetical protein Q8932_07890, partial [Bacteroidota bacterium]|nr:hypothetical protein [Bacteroidota bacterium]
GLACLAGCGGSIKLTIPEKFKEQATMDHVNGAKGKKMSCAHFTTSKIKRGMRESSSDPGRDFFLENVLLNRLGVRKDETVTEEKGRFRYTLAAGENHAEIQAEERQLTVGLEYQAFKSASLFNKVGKLEQYTYLFSAIIATDEAPESRNWELLMTNYYDRNAGNDKNSFTYFKQGAYGLATNGKDTIIIKPLIINNTVTANGKTAQIPFKILSGYELSIDEGVIAIVDMIGQNIWFYNELEPTDKLHVSAIATALFARRVHDEKW